MNRLDDDDVLNSIWSNATETVYKQDDVIHVCIANNDTIGLIKSLAVKEQYIRLGDKAVEAAGKHIINLNSCGEQYLDGEYESRLHKTMLEVYDYIASEEDKIVEAIDDLANKLNVYRSNLNDRDRHLLDESVSLINAMNMYNSSYALQSMTTYLHADERVLPYVLDEIRSMIVSATGNDNPSDEDIDFIACNRWFYQKLIHCGKSAAMMDKPDNRTVSYRKRIRTVMALFHERGEQYVDELLRRMTTSFRDTAMRPVETSLELAAGNVDMFDNAMFMFESDEMKPFRKLASYVESGLKDAGQTFAAARCARILLNGYNGDVDDRLMDRLLHDDTVDRFEQDKRTTNMLTSSIEAILRSADTDRIAGIASIVLMLYLKQRVSFMFGNDDFMDDELVEYANAYANYTVEYADELLKMRNERMEDIIDEIAC